jgi:phosphoribosylformimino-5-aminoimidazole carboxamide ribotide isomerase
VTDFAKTPLPIIPVLDLLGGVVVRGVAGERQNYRPIVSRLTDDPRPASVASALVRHFAPAAVYVADLDAIQYGRPQWDSYREIAAAGVSILLDAGTGTSCAATRVWQFLQRERIAADLVIGLESLAAVSDLDGLLTNFPSERLIFSLDLKHGQPLTEVETWQSLTPAEIAADVVHRGVGRMIVLDLAAVGVGEGVPTLALARQLRDEFPTLELIGGGGVRSREDLQTMAAAGFSAALVASALHDGRIDSVESDRPR